MSKYIPFWKFRDVVDREVYKNGAGNIAIVFRLNEWERTYTTSPMLWDSKRYEEAGYLEHLAHGDYTLYNTD